MSTAESGAAWLRRRTSSFFRTQEDSDVDSNVDSGSGFDSDGPANEPTPAQANVFSTPRRRPSVGRGGVRPLAGALSEEGQAGEAEAELPSWNPEADLKMAPAGDATREIDGEVNAAAAGSFDCVGGLAMASLEAKPHKSGFPLAIEAEAAAAAATAAPVADGDDEVFEVVKRFQVSYVGRTPPSLVCCVTMPQPPSNSGYVLLNSTTTGGAWTRRGPPPHAYESSHPLTLSPTLPLSLAATLPPAASGSSSSCRSSSPPPRASCRRPRASSRAPAPRRRPRPSGVGSSR